MSRPPEDTTSWVAHKLREVPYVERVTVLGPQTLRITRDEYDPFVAGIISTPRVTVDVLEPIIGDDRSIEMVANIPKNAVWTGEAIEFGLSCGFSFGGIGDLMRAVQCENVRAYVRPEFGFVERGLMQHNRVQSLKREFDRVYLVRRRSMPPVRFVMLNEYELTADHVRTARSRYGTFDVILLNNPNGRPTEQAGEVGDAMGVSILMWGQFLGRLNRK